MIYNTVKLGNISIANNLPFVLIAGPCVLESSDHAMFMVDKLKTITTKMDIPFIYKSSFDKANRTSLNAGRGIGIEKSLEIFAKIKKEFNVPIMTDVHSPEQCSIVAEVVDVLQIPAFLCRQTDLLVAAAKTGKVINVKKGQFLAPWDTFNIIKKIKDSGNNNALICERGTSFGYNTLVNDMKGLPIMAQEGTPVIFDATHSVQQPGGQGTSTGGDRRFAPILARAAVAVGVAGLFLETHNDPEKSPSDGPNMINLNDMPEILKVLKDLDLVAKSNLIEL